MTISRKSIGLLCTIALLTLYIPKNVCGQETKTSMVKAGGFVTFRNSSFSSLFFNLESEKNFKKAIFLTHGARLDYFQARPYPQKYFFGHENLTIGYQFKFYPFYFKSRKPFQGLFIGVDPCLYLPVWRVYRSGPGVGGLLGYQQVFKNKMTASFEFSTVYMQNTNKNIPPKNPKDRYFFFFMNLKVGFDLKRE